MTARERVHTVLNGGIPDRVPYQDLYWASTVRRWHGEGLPADTSPEEYFDCDMWPLGHASGLPESAGQFGDTLQLPINVLEENDRHRVYVDRNGATRKEMKLGVEAGSAWTDFMIRGREDWERLKPHTEFQASRIPKGLVDAYRAGRRAEKFAPYFIHACFHPTWEKVGMETLFIWLAEEPELVRDLFAAQVQLVIDIYDASKALGVEFDGAFLLDDFGSTSAPLISPQMYRELVMPHHQRLFEHFAADGLRTMLHSDGNVGPLIPGFLEAGFTALHPLEAKAGLDVRELKSRYGDRLVLFGNIDVRKLAGTPEEVEEEVAWKVTAAKEHGGYMSHSDHSVPSDVPFDNYRLAMATLDRCGGYD